MALSMKLTSVFSHHVSSHRVIKASAGVCRVYETCFSKTRCYSRPHDLHRYLPCCSFSQPASNAPTSTPTKPGLLKRMAVKSDEIFCKVLGSISPWMLQEYGHFKIGFLQFIGDAKSVYRINKRIRNEKLQLTDLHWKDLYLKKQISNDIAKMIPTVILLSLPFVYYFVLPLMFIYPTIFLSNQFLSRDKLLRYYLKSYQQRAALYPTILGLLSEKAGENPSSADKDSIREILKMLQAEQQVTAQQVLLSRNAFHAYRFSQLSRQHLKCLCNLCSLRTMFMPAILLRRKLNKNMALIQAMDLSIKKDGIPTLDHLELEKLCYERGLNVVHSDKSELQAWLDQWLELSSMTSDDDHSFIAHSTALLVIGHPSCGRLQDIPNPTPPKKEASKKA
ncbi:LETM1 domain-containing protein 1-like [Patiria miniata]|uniref:Letm1 RBD domain-containing protein n=1 Tax=Patiria miniata TaxID=46514 RepID=A0A913ZB85_PATMI|nr:LETM1 domain-containing protein 1-like [Patiria miniata]